MNSKMSKLLSEYAAIYRTPLKELKKTFYATPRTKRGQVRENMEAIIRMYWERQRDAK
jgi:hypothetical protein